jgi:hypothetical protein
LPWCLISSRIVLRHVVRGLPQGLVPWGFHSRAAFAMSPGGRRSVWPSHPPTSSAEFLIQLSFAWLSPTVLGLISGPARIFSVFCGCIYWRELAVDAWWF